MFAIIKTVVFKSESGSGEDSNVPFDFHISSIHMIMHIIKIEKNKGGVFPACAEAHIDGFGFVCKECTVEILCFRKSIVFFDCSSYNVPKRIH